MASALGFCVKIFSRSVRIGARDRLIHARPFSKNYKLATKSQLGFKFDNARISSWLVAYEDIVGLKEVRFAQEKVVKAEDVFKKTQDERRQVQTELIGVQQQLREISSQLEKVSRGEERYLDLLTKEHSILQNEKKLQKQLEFIQEEEHSNFAELSASVRESHEKERSRSERTKYWSIIGSIIGAIIGITGTSINNYLRMREFRTIVSDSAKQGNEMNDLIVDISSKVAKQFSQTQKFISDIRGMVENAGDGDMKKQHNSLNLQMLNQDGMKQNRQVEDISKEIITFISREDAILKEEMQAIKALIEKDVTVKDEFGNIIPSTDIKRLLKATEDNLEWKIKANALWTVTAVYAALAVGFPILLSLFQNK